MQRLCLLLSALCLFNFADCQLSIGPSYQDLSYTYNPALSGLNNDSGIFLGINQILVNENRFQQYDDFSIFRLGVDDFVISLNTEELRHLGNTSAIGNLAYYQSLKINEKTKFTIGGHIQYSKDSKFTYRTPQTIGLTANYHVILKNNPERKNYLTLGLQFNHTIQQLNKSIANNIFTDPFFGFYMFVSFDEFTNRYNENLESYNMYLNYRKIRTERHLLNIGLMALLEPNIDYTYVQIMGNPFYLGEIESTTYKFSPGLHLNYQKILFGKVSLDIEFFGITYGGISLGLGFRVTKNKIFRINASQFTDADLNSAVGFKFGIEAERTTWNLYIGELNTFSFIGRETLFQFSAHHKFHRTGAPTLLRLN